MSVSQRTEGSCSLSSNTVIRNKEGAVPLDAALQRIEALVGLRYQQHQWSDLLRLLKPAARELGFQDVAACVAWLAQGDVHAEQVRILGKHLTIGESYFFREIVVFSLLREHIVPELLERKRKSGDRTIRVWSAGCSTGEEVYSLAILLDALLEHEDGWRFHVLGTDINPSALERARNAQYREWSFRDLPDGIIDRYFTKMDDGRYEVVEHIRACTEFDYCNLAEAPQRYAAGFDLLFCRNVLMYFTRAKIRDIVQGFRRSLREGGWLIPSLTETTLIHDAAFEGIRFGEATLFRRQSRFANIIPFSKSRTTAVKDDATLQQEQSAPSAATVSGSSSSERVKAAPSRQRASVIPQLEQAQQGPHSMLEKTAEIDTVRRDNEQIARAPSTDDRSREAELLRLARTLADQGDLEEACTAAKLAVDVAKMDPDTHFMYATILREKGETATALQEFHRALYLDNGYIPAHFAMGSLYQSPGELQRPKRHLRNALELLQRPDDADRPGEISARRMGEIIRTMLGEE